MPGGKTYRCPDCGGSGGCEQCYGSGRNLHLNDSTPECRSCRGTRVCQPCGGTGVLPNSIDLSDAPVFLRVLFSAIVIFTFYKIAVAFHSPGHSNSFFIKAEGWLFSIRICGLILCVIWSGVKRSDFGFNRGHVLSILKAQPEVRSSSRPIE